MSPTMMAVAEQLADEYRDTEPAAVARVVCECLDAFPDGGPWLIEQASRAHLARAAQDREADDGCSRRARRRAGNG